MYGFKFLCGISEGTFEILHKILDPHTAKYAFYYLVFFVCELRYIWIVKSEALVRRAQEAHDVIIS